MIIKRFEKMRDEVDESRMVFEGSEERVDGEDGDGAAAPLESGGAQLLCEGVLDSDLAAGVVEASGDTTAPGSEAEGAEREGLAEAQEVGDGGEDGGERGVGGDAKHGVLD